MDEIRNKVPFGAKKREYRSFDPSNQFHEQSKIPPQAVDIEEAVLGALMLEQNALTAVIDILKPEIFYKDAHQLIFSAIQRLFAKLEPVDILTVTNELKKTGELELIGGAYYISQLTSRIASAANIEYHSRILHQKYIQRELIRISSEISRDAYEDSSDVLDLLDKAESNLFTLGDRNFRRDYLGMSDLVSEAIKEIEKAKEHTGGISGVPSGFSSLDRLTSGWQKSDFIVIAARPGMGKTAFVLSMARNMAVEFKKAIAIFSLEMSALQLVTRLISSETMLPADKLKKGTLENHEWEQLNAKIKELVEAPIFIDDSAGLSLFELRAKCRRLKAQHKIEMVIIDYIQLMSAGDMKGNREQEISTISRSLKSLAKELNIPVIALSQLNRSVETRTGSKKPILSDLRESGAIEQDADLVLFIYRPEYYKLDVYENGEPTAGMADIIVAKHRNGPLDEIRLRFIKNYAKFTDLNFDYADEGMAPNVKFENGSHIVTRSSRMDDLPDVMNDPGF
ncbi:MAG: replicative DNA helicase [Bacteroidetes bacterium]|nr:replicative DNA helicase [Bacteroidota bacterium]